MSDALRIPTDDDAGNASDYSPAEDAVWEFVVEPTADRQRADFFLQVRFPWLSQTKLRLLFARGAVLCNGQVANGGHRLRENDRMRFHWDQRALPPVLPEAIAVSTLWEDGAMAVFDKPAGMLMHPTRGNKRGTLTNAVLHLWNEARRVEEEGRAADAVAEAVRWPRFVNRLDRGTSGMVVAAKSADVAGTLGKAFAAREARKLYLAVLDGRLPEGRNEDGWLAVSQPVGRVREERPQWDVATQGAPAESAFRAIAVEAGRTLAVLRPITGRTNQLRIHAAWLGAPILGDGVYGGATAGRLYLHAWRLRVKHPQTGEMLSLETPPGDDFRAGWPLMEEALAAEAGTW